MRSLIVKLKVWWWRVHRTFGNAVPIESCDPVYYERSALELLRSRSPFFAMSERRELPIVNRWWNLLDIDRQTIKFYKISDS